MTRAEANLKIADILSSTVWEQRIAVASGLRFYTTNSPQQRAAQIICNYICGDYRDPNPRPTTKEFMEALFPGNPDPFYEESEVTLKRLTKIIDKL